MMCFVWTEFHCRKKDMAVRKRKVVLKNFVVLVLSMFVGAQALVAIAEEAIEEVVVVGKSIKASTQSCNRREEDGRQRCRRDICRRRR